MFSRLALILFVLPSMLSAFAVAHADDSLKLSPTSVEIEVGQSARVRVSETSGEVTVVSSAPSVASASYSDGRITVKGLSAGSATVAVKDRESSGRVETEVLPGAGSDSDSTGSDSGSTGSTSANTGYALVAWNDLGMHCMDGDDYSIFSILPPYNNLHAQLVDKATGQIVTSGVSVTYQAVADASGSINTISSTKTNFWQYALDLFGLSPAPDVGLTGNPVPSNTPAAMTYNAAAQRFEADAIPLTPVDDSMHKNYYPMVQLVAKSSTGQVLATTKTVLPISDEMNCAACHSSTTSTTTLANAARPSSGWVFNGVPERDWKENILKLHDDKQLSDPAYTQALAAKGYRDSGLYDTAVNGKPVLCAACHADNALPGTGVTGIEPLTQALHSMHAKAIDPTTQLSLNDMDNRNACYMCHPGAQTQCLRGAMGKATDASGQPLMNCQSCHGNMQTVGSPTRVGWLQEPNCQACHHDGKRATQAIDPTYGTLFTPADQRFATNPNVPASGFSLFRLSKGHGGLDCESCHGATHAVYPSAEPNDNVQSIALQGHEGTIAECSVCHAKVPLTTDGGPHGMHTIGDQWVESHGDLTENSGVSACAYCHGSDYRGSVLSTLKTAKTFKVEDGSKSFPAGHQIGCYDCHDGPGDSVAQSLLRVGPSSQFAAAGTWTPGAIAWEALRFLDNGGHSNVATQE